MPHLARARSTCLVFGQQARTPLPKNPNAPITARVPVTSADPKVFVTSQMYVPLSSTRRSLMVSPVTRLVHLLSAGSGRPSLIQRMAALG